MKIVYLSAGAAGTICGTCLHDNTLASALIRAGEEVLLVPLYTPLRSDEPSVSIDSLFFGGINVYLQQKSVLFRHLPRWFGDVLNRPGLVNLATRRATSTQPEQLGALTVSMLQGEEGRQRGELEKLVQWLEREVQPDIVHLSNAMLLGAAREIRQRLDVPIVCSLAGEDVFLERLKPPFYEQAHELLIERSRDATILVALNNYFAEFMANYLQEDRNRIRVIPHGLLLEGHANRSRISEKTTITIGFLTRICKEKGLHLLAEAFIRLSQRRDLPSIKLKVAGYLGRAERKYLADIESRLDEAGVIERYEYVGELDRPRKIEFLQSLDLMCIPTVYQESKGISILEAWANAVPVVVPSHGAFPEMIEDTGGGLLCEPNDVASIEDALVELIQDADRRTRLGQRARQAVLDRYHDTRMAHDTRALYKELLAEGDSHIPSA